MENYPPSKKPRLASASSSTIDAGEQTTVTGASTSPNIPAGSNYQVFLSFRGIDTRTGFADHLYHSLTNAGVFVFRDNNKLRIGEEIAPELLRAISQSRISIPILSERYASSKWCLLELARVIELQKSCGHLVLPIFYKVEPSHVRYQTESFGEAFRSIKNRFELKVVQQWEHALQAVASLSGWESEKTADGYEGELVNIVVRTVLHKLNQDFQLDVPEHLVEIDENVEDIMRRVDLNGRDTKMIGIHGMPGVGKTTLAKFFFNKLSGEHVDRSFIADAGRRARQHGNQYLQNQLISDLLPHACPVSRVDDGINIIKSRFTRKRILFLLDDVDNISQLDALVRERSWFGSGSIIIVTTRDVGILDQARFGVDLKYELKPMDAGKSLILFSKLAFRRDSPPSPFEVLSRDIVANTGGLPLALEAIGSQLYGEKDLGIWQEILKKFRNAPHKKVQEKFRTSYETLDAEAIEIFLDIVSFFIGSPTTYPIYLWEDNNLTPRFQIKNLTCRSMIEVGYENKFIVHGQLRNFGLTIIRQEDWDNPTNRSRICEHEEAWTLLDGPQGSKNIQGIRLYESFGPSQKVGVCKSEQLEKFPNLRLLQLKNVNLVGDFQNVLHELRLLEWHMDEDLLPIVNNFHLPNLTILKLSSRFISNDWTQWSSMKMARLKVLDLSYCTRLRTTPNLSTCRSLEVLKLQHCSNLEQIDTSIIEVRGTLLVLDLSYCTALDMIALQETEDLLKLELELDLTGTFLQKLLRKLLWELLHPGLRKPLELELEAYSWTRKLLRTLDKETLEASNWTKKLFRTPDKGMLEEELKTLDKSLTRKLLRALGKRTLEEELEELQKPLYNRTPKLYNRTPKSTFGAILRTHLRTRTLLRTRILLMTRIPLRRILLRTLDKKTLEEELRTLGKRTLEEELEELEKLLYNGIPELTFGTVLRTLLMTRTPEFLSYLEDEDTLEETFQL